MSLSASGRMPHAVKKARAASACPTSRGLLFAAALLLSSARAGTASAPAGGSILDGIAAWVNESAITIGEVMSLVAPVRRQLAATCSGAELEARTRKAYDEALESLVLRRLVLDRQSREKVKIPDWFVEQRIDETVRDRFHDDRSALLDALARERLSYDEWKENLRDQLLVSYLMQTRVDARVYVSPRALREAYERNLDAYRIGGRIRLRMIVLRKRDSEEAIEAKRRLAEAVRQRAAAGEDFAALAREVSEDRRAADGGDWGWIRPDVLRADLAREAERLAVGEVSAPIETPDAFYVLKLEGREEVRTPSFVEVARRIERDLRAQERERVQARWAERLKRHACIRVFAWEPEGEP